MKKNRIILFIVLLLTGFYITNILFNRLDRKTFNILNSSNEKIDLVFVGSSHSYSTFNTRSFDNKMKINTYALSTDAQPLSASYYLLKEFYKKRTPKLIVLELYGALLNPEEKGSYENVLNSFSLGRNKIEASKILKESNEIDYLFPIIKYHAVWKEPNQIIKNIIATMAPPYKGSVTYWENSTKILDDVTEIRETKYSQKDFEIDKKNIEYLKLIKDEAKIKNIELIFTVAPVFLNEDNYKVLELKNKIEKEISDIEIIDFNTIEFFQKLNITRKDFLDAGHLNLLGATKVSEYMMDYIGKNYKIESSNYKKNSQEDFDELYIYGIDRAQYQNLKIMIKDENIQDLIVVNKRKNVNNFLLLLDSFNVGVISKQKIIEFFKSKDRYNLYIEVDPSIYNEKDKYKIEFWSENRLVKSLLKDNAIEISRDNKGQKIKIPKNDIWLINKKSYLVEKNIFLNEKIDRIEVERI